MTITAIYCHFVLIEDGEGFKILVCDDGGVASRSVRNCAKGIGIIRKAILPGCVRATSTSQKAWVGTDAKLRRGRSKSYWVTCRPRES